MDHSVLAARLRDEIGNDGVVDDRDIMASYETDWTGRFQGRAGLVLRPSTTEELAAAVHVTTSAALPIVPQGGNTGLVGASIPRNGEVLVSTRRMAGIEDAGSNAELVVGAGTTLADLQRHARGKGMEFGIDIAARESATLGGMIATNAGGNHVIRWGRMRAQVLGLEVVLPDGEVLDHLDDRPHGGIAELEDFLVGSEGTLGIVSRARLRLIPRPEHEMVTLLSLASLENAIRVTTMLREGIGDLTAVEYFGREAVELVRAHFGIQPPFGDSGEAYLLIELAGRDDQSAALQSLLEDGPGILDSAVAVDPAGRRSLWALRENITESINAVGIPQKYDVWLPPSEVPQFKQSICRITARVGAELVLFGHLGEGSVHANVVGLEPGDQSIEADIFRVVLELGGNPSSEHGVGLTKVRWHRKAMSPVELRVMRSVKQAFDPEGLLNPGVLVPTR